MNTFTCYSMLKGCDLVKPRLELSKASIFDDKSGDRRIYLIMDNEVSRFKGTEYFTFNDRINHNIFIDMLREKVVVLNQNIATKFKYMLDQYYPGRADEICNSPNFECMIKSKKCIKLSHRDILVIIRDNTISSAIYDESNILVTIKNRQVKEYFQQAIDDLKNDQLAIVPVDFTFKCNCCSNVFGVRRSSTDRAKPETLRCPNCDHLVINDYLKPSLLY